MSTVQNLSRRGFLHSALAGGCLVLGTSTGTRLLSALAGGDRAAVDFAPNLFVAIDGKGTVTILAHRSEMGTGIRTALPLVLADELDALRDRIEIQQAIGDKRLGDQNTDGSKSIRDFYQPMREAGASARLMLIQAAAQAWGVPSSECIAKEHAILHPETGRRADFGELVAAAAKLPVPAIEELQFKTPDQWRYVGKEQRSTDDRALTTGAATFGLDVRPEGCVFAVVARCPVVGGQLVSKDDRATRKLKGVLDVLEIPRAEPPYLFKAIGGVAVIAVDTWSAWQGRDALELEWDLGPNKEYDSAAYRKQLEATVRKPCKVVRQRGDVAAAMDEATTRHSADYYLPHLAHAAMEPPCAVARVSEKGCEIWAPVQNPQAAQDTVAQALGLDPAQVTCHVTLLGGGFGRKSKPDFCAEAALLSKQLGKPVKVVWTREDDIRHDYYHSVAALHLEAALDAKGSPTAWLQRTAFPTIMSTFDPTAREGSPMELGLGFTDLPYTMPNIQVEVGEAKSHLRIGWLRSVSNVYHAFAISSFTDELAHKAGRDPVDYTLELIGEPRQMDFDGAAYPNYGQPLQRFPPDAGRLAAVARLCAKEAAWGKPLPRGRGQGFAVHRSFLSYVACVVEVEIDKDGTLKIPRVDIAIDCGLAVSPDRVRAQMEGSVVFGQSLTLYGEISAKGGAVQQSNFHDYQVVRINEAPREIHVHLVPSKELPAGVGEPGVPPIAPALCNAIAQAIGKRIRELPLAKQDLRWS